MFTFNDSLVLVKRSRWVFWGGKMIKKGIWKILLRNDRLKKSRVRRFKKQLERSNNRLAASSRLSLSLVLLKQGGRWDTEPKRTQSHQSSFQFAEDFETLRLFIVVEKKRNLFSQQLRYN